MNTPTLKEMIYPETACDCPDCLPDDPITEAAYIKACTALNVLGLVAESIVLDPGLRSIVQQCVEDLIPFVTEWEDAWDEEEDDILLDLVDECLSCQGCDRGCE